MPRPAEQHLPPERERTAPHQAAPLPRPAREHVVLQLQRSAGNAAVVRLLRDTAPASVKPPPGPGPAPQTDPQSKAQFMNTYMALTRGLRAKLDSRQRLDRIDLDTLFELLAEARRHQLQIAIAECQELIGLADRRGVVAAPEEAPPVFDEARVKERVRRTPTFRDGRRGGRAFGTVDGVEYTLYERDDLLLAAADADRIETLLRQVLSIDQPNPPDPEALWRSVLDLIQAGHPPADVITMLEMTAGPDVRDLFEHWWTRAVKQAKDTLVGKPHEVPRIQESPPKEQPRGGALPDAAKRPFRKGLERQARENAGVDPQVASSVEKLKWAVMWLTDAGEAHNRKPGGPLVQGEFTAFEAALHDVLTYMGVVDKLEAGGNLGRIGQVQIDKIERVIATAYLAESALDAAFGPVAPQPDEVATPFVKPRKQETKEKRTGGDDGVWDAGFDAVRMIAWVADKSDRAIKTQNIKACVEYIEVHKGKGGGIKSAFGGLTVFHISRGQKGSSDGCSLFFTRDAQGTVTIVGIAGHSTGVSYVMDWKLAGWTDGIWPNPNNLVL
jgi:hypothetical protein